ncbi:MAG: sulfoxide reductase heme-binding subunit YedZ [Proteobacteria bacterium]|nr:sulfoxide reductase heme-binding subunit YedZ [Pseudomonadota bacterium]
MLRSSFAKPVLFILCLVPISALVWRAFYGDLGANPIETITRDVGDWTLRFLLITIAISPLRQWFGWTVILRFRRMLGLYVFFYAFCHFLIWFVADHSFDFSEMLEDIIKRPYITFGFSAFLLLVPLAVTSNQSMVRRLGKRWKQLHRLTYAIVMLGVLHYLWQVKADYLEPGIYAVIAGLLLLQRVDFKKWFDARTSVQSSKPA